MSHNPRSARQQFKVTLIGGEKVEVETRYSDLLTVERTLIGAGLSANPQANPVHYVTCLIWAAMVRENLTGLKWREFPDMILDYDETDEEGPTLDPTRPGPFTGSPSTSHASMAEDRPTG